MKEPLKRSGFTLMELIIVIVIIALAAVFSFKAWSAHLVKAEFDGAVNEFIAVFQEARSYAVKNAEVDSGENTSYTISFVSEEVITLSGDVSGEVLSDSWIDLLNFDCGGDWSVSYTAPYADFTVDSGEDIDGNLTCIITSTRGDLSRDIIVRASSGIAEIVR